jgi:hypothetical protein
MDAPFILHAKRSYFILSPMTYRKKLIEVSLPLEAETLENIRLAFFPELTVPVEEEPQLPVEKQLGLFEEALKWMRIPPILRMKKMDKSAKQFHEGRLQAPIQRRLWMVFFLCISFLTYGSTGYIKANNAQPVFQQTDQRRAISVGVECFSLIDNNWNLLKGTNTTGAANEATKKLKKIGFSVAEYKTPADFTSIANELSQAEVFFYAGHGYSGGLAFVDGDCRLTGLVTSSNLQNVTAPGLRLAVISACLTGENIQDPNNFLMALQRSGAHKVIGFNRTINSYSMGTWSKIFWRHMLEDGMEAGEAARKAAGEIVQDDWLNAIVIGRIDEASLVVLGDEEVRLLKETSASPAPLPAIIQTLWETVKEGATRILSAGWNDIKERAGKWLEGIQKDLEEWFAKTAQEFLKNLLKELDRALYQMCCASGPTSMVIAGAFLHSMRKRKR